MKKLLYSIFLVLSISGYAYSDTFVDGLGGGVAEGTDVGFRNATATSIKVEAGTAASPSISFVDGDTGFYEHAGDKIGVSVNGTRVFGITNDQIHGNVVNNFDIYATRGLSYISPQYSWFGDSNTGLAHGSVGTVSLVAAGVETLRNYTTYSEFYPSGTGQVTIWDDGSLAFDGTLTGGFSLITSNTTLNGHFSVDCDASGGDIDITLPTAVGIAGRMYYVKKIDGTHNACNMVTNGTETIDGLDDGANLNDPYISVGFRSDGINWDIFIRRASGGSVSPTLANYSVIGAFVDWTSVSRLAKKDGDYLRIQEVASDPGFQAWWTFPGIHAPSEIIFEGCIYDGADNDDVEAIIFSNASSAWHDLRVNTVDANPSESDFQHTPYSDEGSPHDRHYDVPSPPGDYVDSSGNVLVGIKHTEAGSTTHDWYCDAIHVKDY